MGKQTKRSAPLLTRSPCLGANIVLSSVRSASEPSPETEPQQLKYTLHAARRSHLDLHSSCIHQMDFPRQLGRPLSWLKVASHKWHTKMAKTTKQAKKKAGPISLRASSARP